jgi:hypothetical protein
MWHQFLPHLFYNVTCNYPFKHEIIRCERCRKRIECRVNSFTQCQCSTVQLNLNEMQYISENYDGCMCASCLSELKAEYQALLTNNN